MLQEQEQKLFEEWKSSRGYKFFVSDGVFEKDAWNSKKVKITFILKEANCPNKTQDLCDWLIDQEKSGKGGWQTWNNIARWSKALLEGGEYPAYISAEERRKWLTKVSFLNLKKEGGGPKAKPKKIREAAQNDAGFIQRQLSLYQPDLIICCGKWLVSDILEKEVLSREGFPVLDREEVDGVFCFYTHFPGKERLTPVVDFYHPEWFKGGHEQWRIFFEQMKAIRSVFLLSSKAAEPSAGHGDLP